MERRYHYVTSESVAEGHPDKICDQVSDAILDVYLQFDPLSHVAIETMVSKDMLVIAGEVLSVAQVDAVAVAKEVLKKIGYTEEKKGFDAGSCKIVTNIHRQSPDIDRGVTKTFQDGRETIGGGDQGIMYGYAVRETRCLMPLPAFLANRLAMQLDYVRKEGKAGFLYPDGKTQVTFGYDEEGNPKYIKSIVVSAQHAEEVSHDIIEHFIKKTVIEPVIDAKWMRKDTKIHINPTGRFVTGGPAGDTGVTGRKLMVDTYGTISHHGGGAFSGKDPTKVDRSAAYMARYVAKNIVAAGLAPECEVAVSYVIGQTEPESVTVDTFHKGVIPDAEIEKIIRHVFSFSVADIIESLELRRPQYLKTAVYGHFGREDQGFVWEKIDKSELLETLAF